MGKQVALADDAPCLAPGESFGAVYEEYRTRVRALATRRLHNRDLADDVVQETFLRAYRARASFDSGRPPWPWLKAIASNLCTDMQREGCGWREVPDDDATFGLDERCDESADPSDAYFSAERRRTMVEALTALTPRQRRVVVLRDVEGWKHEDIASLEGSSAEAIKGALKRGRQTFRTQYVALATTRGLLAWLAAFAATVGGLARRIGRRTAKVGSVPLAAGNLSLVSLSSSLATASGFVAVIVIAGGIAMSAQAYTTEIAAGTRVSHDLPAPSALVSAAPTARANVPDRLVGAGLDTGAGKSASIELARGDGASADMMTAEVDARLVDGHKWGDAVASFSVDLRCDYSAVREAACAAATAGAEQLDSAGTPPPAVPGA